MTKAIEEYRNENVRRIAELTADRDDARATIAIQVKHAKREHERAIAERDDAVRALADERRKDGFDAQGVLDIMESSDHQASQTDDGKIVYHYQVILPEDVFVALRNHLEDD